MSIFQCTTILLVAGPRNRYPSRIRIPLFLSLSTCKTYSRPAPLSCPEELISLAKRVQIYSDISLPNKRFEEKNEMKMENIFNQLLFSFLQYNFFKKKFDDIMISALQVTILMFLVSFLLIAGRGLNFAVRLLLSTSVEL